MTANWHFENQHRSKSNRAFSKVVCNGNFRLIVCQKNPNFNVFEGKEVGERGSNFKRHLSNAQKALPWRERRLMTYYA